MTAALIANHAAPVTGLVVTRYGHTVATSLPGVEVIEAGHPLVDEHSIDAGRRALEIAASAGAGDRVFVLLSGGASALLESPLPDLRLADLVAVNRDLLAAGADIHSINTVRRRLSALKGGRLAQAAAPAETVVLAISDVPGDRLADIGSGPCSAAADDPSAAARILHEYECAATPAVWSTLEATAAAPAVTPDAWDLHAHIVARPADAVTAATAAARAAGFDTLNLGADLGGPARLLAAEHANIARDLVQRRGRFAIVSGGETTVRVDNPRGRGGRNTEYALALALELDGLPGICALAADTDGIDGTGDNAGAFVVPDTLSRAVERDLSARECLEDSRSYEFFASLDDLFSTGPTLTNVNDIRIILIVNG